MPGKPGRDALRNGRNDARTSKPRYSRRQIRPACASGYRERPLRSPLPTFSTNHRRADTFKLFTRQSISDRSRAKHISHRGERQAKRSGHLHLLPPPGLRLYASFSWRSRRERVRGQRFRKAPEVVGNLPSFYTCHSKNPLLLLDGLLLYTYAKSTEVYLWTSTK